MRVLLAVHAFPPSSTGGVEVYTLRLGRALQALGHEVQVLAAVHDLAAAEHDVRRRVHEGVDVVEIVNTRRAGTLASTYRNVHVDALARRLLEDFHPDVLHVQHLVNLSAGIVDEARRAGVPVVLTLHDHWLRCPRDGLRFRADLVLCETVDHAVCARCLAQGPQVAPPGEGRLLGLAQRLGLGRTLHRVHDAFPRATESMLSLVRRVSPREDLSAALDDRVRVLASVLPGVDRVIAPTAFVAERARESGLPMPEMQVQPLGATAHPARPRVSEPRRRVAFVGTLAPHKGVHVLIDAFRGLPDADLRLDLHGSLTVAPAYVHDLRRRAEGDPRIHFHGPFPAAEQPRIFASLDVLVLLEALAEGKLVIASRTGGIPEVVGANGRLVAPGDVAALREALDDVTSGRSLAGGGPAPSIPTAEEGAIQLVALYESLRPTR